MTKISSVKAAVYINVSYLRRLTLETVNFELRDRTYLLDFHKETENLNS